MKKVDLFDSLSRAVLLYCLCAVSEAVLQGLEREFCYSSRQPKLSFQHLTHHPSAVRSVLGEPAPSSGLCETCPHMHIPSHKHTCIYRTKNYEIKCIKNPPWANDKGPVRASVLNLWVVAPLVNLHLQNYLYYDS